MSSAYVTWLQEQGIIRLFRLRDIYWRLYNGVLVPASPAPHFLELSYSEIKDLLSRSRAWFLRYSSHHCDKETAWWHIVHDSDAPVRYSANTRSKINRGNRHCLVERVAADWLAEHGYGVYRAAHERYANATPLAPETFRINVLGTKGGPIEYWGVFVDKNLAGYCQCIVEEHNVDTSVTRFDPAYLKFYTSYALMSHLVDHYAVKNRIPLSNGERSIVHDTNFQDFLLKLGFRKQFCRMNIAYQPEVKAIVRIMFPFRKTFAALPHRNPVHKIKALLLQEEIRRQCL
jgi:hypothetical protein